MSDYLSIINDVTNKLYKPVYLLMGEEVYYIDIVSDTICNSILTSEEKEFNYTVLYGRDIHIDDLINACKRFPMMSAYQVIVVKEAQNIAKIEHLEYYLQQPLLSTILVLEYRHGKVDARKKFYKLAQKVGEVYTSNRIYENRIPDWIKDYLANKKVSISPKAALMIAEYLGSDLSKIVNELEKLILTLPENKREITAQHVEDKIGISKDYNNFEFIKALGMKNVLKSNQIVNYFIDNPKNNPTILTLITLFNFFSNLMIYYYLTDKNEASVASVLRVHPFVVKEYASASKCYTAGKVLYIVSQIREYDARVKGVGNVSSTSGELLKELVFKILH